jgi:hypothetical protein
VIVDERRRDCDRPREKLSKMLSLKLELKSIVLNIDDALLRIAMHFYE